MSVDLSVFNFFENVTLMLAWIVNNAIWDVLNTSLLAGLPFLALILREWYDARREGEDEGNKGLLALNRIETTLYAMLVIYAFTAVPLMTVSFAPVNIDQDYLQECGVRVAAGGTTTSGGAAIGGQTADIPVWWAVVHAVSHGMTNVALAALPCQTDYQYIRTELNNTAIQDPKLRNEVAQFQRACYGAARAKLFRDSDQVDPEVAQDTDWVGSPYFVNTPGYYDSFQAQNPVRGFAYNPQRDLDTGTDPSLGGYPMCDQWWQASGNGLRARLYDQIDPSIWDNISAAFTSAAAEDYAIRGLLRNGQGGAAGNAGRNVVNGDAGGNWFSQTIGSVTGLFGTGLATLPAEGMKDVMARSLPMVQFLVLMAIVIAMPFVIVISGYSFKVAGILTFSYFGVVSMSFWFALSRWLNNHLVDMLYQSQALKLGYLGGLNNAYDQGVLGLVQAAMLLIFPTLWMAMLAWAGFSVGSGIGSAIQLGAKDTGAAGKEGGKKAQGG